MCCLQLCPLPPSGLPGGHSPGQELAVTSPPCSGPTLFYRMPLLTPPHLTAPGAGGNRRPFLPGAGGGSGRPHELSTREGTWYFGNCLVCCPLIWETDTELSSRLGTTSARLSLEPTDPHEGGAWTRGRGGAHCSVMSHNSKTTTRPLAWTTTAALVGSRETPSL